MERHTFAMEITCGKTGDFRRSLGVIWEDLTRLLDAYHIRNFSVWQVERIVFGYYETEDVMCFDTTAKRQIEEWELQYGHLYTWLSTPFEKMRLMYHDFGVVRTCKELIRHRVFVTKLKKGQEEEYKARHDALVEKRGEQVTQGPDSNFSIWYAGGYIFGYNEIDTTMEHEMTEEEKEATIQWETKMLEIMTWLTNDVDWITGEHHQNIQRLCWHN